MTDVLQEFRFGSATCLDCGEPLPPKPPGAGRRSPRCAACRIEHRRAVRRARWQAKGAPATAKRIAEPPPDRVVLAAATCGECGAIERCFRDGVSVICLRCWWRERTEGER